MWLVGMASTARLGLKHDGHGVWGKIDNVGMASTARLGLKLVFASLSVS